MPRKLDHIRQTLLENGKAYLLQNEDGRYGKFNLRELTRQSGIALGTFYHYFEDKDDLVRQIMQEDWDSILKELDAIELSEEPLRDKIWKLYQPITAFTKRYHYAAIAFFRMDQQNQEFQKKNMTQMTDRIKAFLQREVQRGVLLLEADYDDAAYLLLQLFFATSRNPGMDFDDLWKCMNFQVIDRKP